MAKFYSWRKKYTEMEANKLKHLNEFEDETIRLMRMCSDLELHHQMFKEVLGK